MEGGRLAAKPQERRTREARWRITFIRIIKSIIFSSSSSISTVSCIHICNCNMNDRGMDNLIIIMAPP